MSKITEYFIETKGELKHVVWPTRAQAVFYTVVVIVLSVVLAYILGFFDSIFSMGLDKLLSL